MFLGIIPYAHQLLKEILNNGDIAIDATSGNGNDTLFLAKQVGNEGTVYSYDVQAQAIENTKSLLAKHHIENTRLIHDGHEKIEHYLQEEHKGAIRAAIFNLGYLPRSDKKIITKAPTTLSAIQTILKHLKIGGRIVLVVYHGHEGGKEEKNAILDYVSTLNQTYYGVIQYGFINQVNAPPFIVAIEKRK